MEMRDFLPDIDMEKLENVIKIQRQYENNEISVDKAKEYMKDKVKTLKPYEIAVCEQKLKKFDVNECKKERIQEMLILYSDILDISTPVLEETHPIKKYYNENEIMTKYINELKEYIDKKDFIKMQELFSKIYKWKIHLSRKQNQLYSVLEKKGFDRPTTTMWVLDDFVLDELRNMFSHIKNKDIEKIENNYETLKLDVLDLISKENTILYPTSLAMIKEDEFKYMIEGDNEIGYFELEENKATNENDFAKDLDSLLSKYGYKQNNKKVNLSNGELSEDVLNLILKNLPIDISFVDEKNIVKYYNDTKHRVFPRSKNAIGRDVINCHPPKSYHIVNEIIEKFRNNEEDEAEFYIDKEDIFIYIKYIAIRDEFNNFKGILEIMQDATHIRSLKGSKTLLSFEKKQVEVKDLTKLTKETRLKDLLDKYPNLKEYLVEISPKFKMLNSPLGRVMIPRATIGIMSERSQVDLELLINKISEFIEKEEK